MDTGAGVEFITDPSGYVEHQTNAGFDWFEGKTGSHDIQSSFQNVDEPVVSVLALLSASAGVTTQREVWGAMLAHFVWWATGNKGVDALYSFLAGAEMYKRKFAYAVFPTLKDLGDLRKDRAKRNMIKSAIWFCGYGAAMYRYV